MYSKLLTLCCKIRNVRTRDCVIRMVAGMCRLLGLVSSKVRNPYPIHYDEEVLRGYADLAFNFVKDKNLNTDYCLLLDYSIPSGSPRLFLWSFAERKSVFCAHTMHGTGGGSTPEKAILGNVPESLCSSEGRFVITHEQGDSVFPSYRLRGLDATNNNAYTRDIMLHGTSFVDVFVGKVDYLPLNQYRCAGCVATSTAEMSFLEQFINRQSKLLLLWSFKS